MAYSSIFNIGDHVMIMSGKLDSYWGVIVGIRKRKDGVKMYRVDTLDENNKETVRSYIASSIMHWRD